MTILNKVKILIADNQLLVREGIKGLLYENEVYQVAGEANDGNELEEKLKTIQPDIVIIDYDIPGFFHLRDIQKIYQLSPQTRVMVITGNQKKKDILQVLDYGVNNYILKLCDREEFMSALEATLQKEKFFCSKVIDTILEKHFPKKQHWDSPTLSQREIEIVELVTQGMTNSEIAHKLFLSIHTVSTHRKNILRKLQVKSASELVLYAIKNGIVAAPEKN